MSQSATLHRQLLYTLTVCCLLCSLLHTVAAGAAAAEALQDAAGAKHDYVPAALNVTSGAAATAAAAGARAGTAAAAQNLSDSHSSSGSSSSSEVHPSAQTAHYSYNQPLQPPPTYYPDQGLPLPAPYPYGYPHPDPNPGPPPLPFPESDLSWGGGIFDPLPPLPPGPFPPGPDPGPFPPPGPGPNPPPGPGPNPPPGPGPNPHPPPSGPDCNGCPPGSSCALCPRGTYSAGNRADTTASSTPCMNCPTGQTTSEPGATSQQQCVPAAGSSEVPAIARAPAAGAPAAPAVINPRDKSYWQHLATDPRPQAASSDPSSSSGSGRAMSLPEDAAAASQAADTQSSADGASDDQVTADAAVAVNQTELTILGIDAHGGKPWGPKHKWGSPPSSKTNLPWQQLERPDPPRMRQIEPAQTASCWCPAGRRCLACAAGTYSMGNPSDVNMQSTQCSACPTGSTTSGTGGKSVSDCNVCFPGRAGLGCPLCPVGSWSRGGDAAMTSCTPCGPGTTTSAPGATGPEMCLAAACGSLGNEITTINPGPPWTEQTSTGNLASTTTTLPSLCPAFGTTQPLPKGAAFFIIEPASTNFRLIEATTCVPAQGAAFALQAFSSSADCSQLTASSAPCPDPSSMMCPSGSQVGHSLSFVASPGQKYVLLLACREQPGGGVCNNMMPYALSVMQTLQPVPAV